MNVKNNNILIEQIENLKILNHEKELKSLDILFKDRR